MGTDLIVESLEVYQVSKSQKLTRIAFINMKGLVCRTIIKLHERRGCFETILKY
jgi:hypothetical protein